MVYFGPSRGCETCKNRRKKCDETRPSCLRCLKTGRTCRGYEESGNVIFRQLEAPPPNKWFPFPLPFKSMARKCSLSPRAPVPGTNTLPEDGPPKEVSERDIEDFALRAFFHDYCVVPINPAFSPGFLGGLELMVHRKGLQSPVATACRAVAFASHGLKLSRPFLTRKAEMLYQDLLGSLAQSVQNPALANSAETLVITILLGLYEMIMAGDTNPGYHNAHAGGMAAIMQIENNPLALLQAVRSGHPLVVNAMAQNYGMFSAPCMGSGSQNLDTLLLKLGSILQKSEILLFSGSPVPISPYDFLVLHDEAMSLDKELELWQKTQNKDVKPISIGIIPQTSTQHSPEAGSWPGHIHTYFDLYVASVWNISRVARCFLLNLILRLSHILENASDHEQYRREAITLMEDVIASIPYHLTEDLQGFVSQQRSSAQMKNPGRPIGGLLLLHPIYIASQLSVVPLEMREYFRKCLAWIATEMGIGHALLFARPQQVDKQYFAGGCMIIWAGLLI